MSERERDLELLNAEEASWARLLSGPSQLSAADETATEAVLSRLRAERARPLEASQEDWDRSLSRAAQLREVDFAAVHPALVAVMLERHRAQHRRLVLSRVIAGFAAAAVIAGALVLRAPHDADPSEAYTAYQEANQGW